MITTLHVTQTAVAVNLTRRQLLLFALMRVIVICEWDGPKAFIVIVYLGRSGWKSHTSHRNGSRPRMGSSACWPSSPLWSLCYQRELPRHLSANSADTEHLHNICTASVQRQRRWADVVHLLHKCCVFAVKVVLQVKWNSDAVFRVKCYQLSYTTLKKTLISPCKENWKKQLIWKAVAKIDSYCKGQQQWPLTFQVSSYCCLPFSRHYTRQSKLSSWSVNMPIMENIRTRAIVLPCKVKMQKQFTWKVRSYCCYCSLYKTIETKTALLSADRVDGEWSTDDR